MNWKKLFFTAVAVLCACFAVLFISVFFRYQAWKSDPAPAQKLASYFSHITKSDFRYRTLEWRLLPFPTARFSEPVFNFKTELKHELKAKSLELRLDLFKLITGNFGFSGLRLRQGEWRGELDAPKGVHDFLVENIDLKTEALNSGKPVKLYMTGDVGGRRKAVIIHGQVKLPALEDTSLNSLGFQVQVLTRNFRFDDSPEWEFLGWIPSSGTSDFLIELTQEPKSDRIQFSGNAGLRDLSFRSVDSPRPAIAYKVGNLLVKFGGYFSPSTDEIKLTKCSAALPFSQINLQGAYLPHAREFRAMTFSFSNVKLDELPTYFPDLKNRIPYFIGFSGIADFSASLNGFASRLKIYSDLDLTRALFTYGRFFQKPKDKPFRVKADMDWTNKKLSGEFSGNFEALTFKGNLPEWQPTGEVKMNLITNSFQAEQLTGYVPFLANYDFGGNMKLFSSFEGKLQGPEPMQKMFHVNLEKGRILRKGTGAGFKDVDLDFDSGPLMIEAKTVKFSLGGSFFEGKINGLRPENNPVWNGTITSQKLVAADVWKEWTAFWGGEKAAWLSSLHPWLQKIISSSEPFEDFIAEFSLNKGVSEIKSFELRALDGQITGSAISQPAESGSKVEVQMDASGMDAGKLANFLGSSQPAMEGKISLQTKLEANRSLENAFADWRGPFSMVVEDGALNRFNYVRALEQMEPLKEASREPADRMQFNKLQIQGQLVSDHLRAETIKLGNAQLQVEGAGEISQEGIMNLRLKTSLESGYFRELFPKRADLISDNAAYFGPVTLLVSGSLDDLRLKPDPQSVADLAEQIVQQKTEKLSKFF